MNSLTFPNYKKAKEHLNSIGFGCGEYVKEKPIDEFFVEEFKHQDGRVARLLDMTNMSWWFKLNTMDTHLVQIK